MYIELSELQLTQMEISPCYLHSYIIYFDAIECWLNLQNIKFITLCSIYYWNNIYFKRYWAICNIITSKDANTYWYIVIIVFLNIGT